MYIKNIIRYAKETLINCLCGRIAALRGARNLNIFQYMPRFLRSVRLALHTAQTINQCFLKCIFSGMKVILRDTERCSGSLRRYFCLSIQ